jgi:hypothetical protein
MAVNRAMSMVALLLSLVAIALSVRTMQRDPLGTDLSKYDLSSPEQTLRSINRMATKQDIRAALQLLKSEVQDEGKDIKLFLSDGVTLTVLKSIEMSNSGAPKNNGLVSRSSNLPYPESTITLSSTSVKTDQTGFNLPRGWGCSVPRRPRATAT